MKVLGFATLCCAMVFGGRESCDTPKTVSSLVPCSQHKLCGSCTRSKNCGWCGSSQKCMDGSSTGPNKPGICEAGAWDYEFCLKEPCSVYSSCRACTADLFCGWCPSERTCSDGKSATPTSGSCADWSYGKCPAECSGLPESEAVGAETKEAPGVPAGTSLSQNKAIPLMVTEEDDSGPMSPQPPSDLPPVKAEKCEGVMPCGVGRDCRVGSSKDVPITTADDPPPSLDKRDMPEPKESLRVITHKVSISLPEGFMSKSRMNAGMESETGENIPGQISDIVGEDVASPPLQLNVTRGTRKQPSVAITSNQRRLTSPDESLEEELPMPTEETEDEALSSVLKRKVKKPPSTNATSFGRTAKIPSVPPTLNRTAPPMPTVEEEEAEPIMNVQDFAMNETVPPNPAMPDTPPTPQHEPEEDRPLSFPEEKQEPEPDQPNTKPAKCTVIKEEQLSEKPAIKFPEAPRDKTMPDTTSGESETPVALPPAATPTPFPKPACKKCAACSDCPNPCPNEPQPPCNLTQPANLTKSPHQPPPTPAPGNKTIPEDKRWKMPVVLKPPALPESMLPPLPPALFKNATNVSTDQPPAPDEIEPPVKIKRKCQIPPPIADIEDVITKEGANEMADAMDAVSPHALLTSRRGTTSHELIKKAMEKAEGDVSIIMPNGPASHSNTSTANQYANSVQGKIPMPNTASKVLESKFFPQHRGPSEQFDLNAKMGMPLGQVDPSIKVPEMGMKRQEEQIVSPSLPFPLVMPEKIKENKIDMPDPSAEMQKNGVSTGASEFASGQQLNLNSISAPMAASDMNANDEQDESRSGMVEA